MGKRVVVFGAGAVGRGFLGEIFHDAGWTVSFLDIDSRVVEGLHRDGGYEHVTVGRESVTKWIGGVVAGHPEDAAHVRSEVAAASCLATCVGAARLPEVADVLRVALLERFAAGGGPIDVLVCENVNRAPALMRSLLVDGLAEADARTLGEQVGLVDTSIGRMIPTPDLRRDGTRVAAEPYKFLPIDGEGVRAGLLGVPELIADDSVPFGYYADRKLFIHSLGHYMCALLGAERGADTIAEAVSDPWILHLTRAAMVESALAVSARWGVPPHATVSHVDDLLHRFANEALGDTIARVVRDPARKMGDGDRLVGALRSAVAAGVPYAHVALGVVAGVLALEREEGTAAESVIRHVVDEVAPDAEALMAAQLAQLRSGFDGAVQVDVIGATYDPPRIP